MIAGGILEPTRTREQHHESAQYFVSGKNRWQAKAALQTLSGFPICKRTHFKTCVRPNGLRKRRVGGTRSRLESGILLRRWKLLENAPTPHRPLHAVLDGAH